MCFLYAGGVAELKACTDSADKALNALHQTDETDQAPIVTLEYAAYMN